jgi:hypothetical protein
LSQFQFRKLPRSLLQPEKQDRLFELGAKFIRAQVEDPMWYPNAERAAAIPQEAQTVYWLWLFVCEASLNGIEVFILEPLGEHSREVHAALTAVGAKELVRRLEAAIPLAREGPAEFLTCRTNPGSISSPGWRSFPRFSPLTTQGLGATQGRDASGSTPSLIRFGTRLMPSSERTSMFCLRTDQGCVAACGCHG